VIADSVVVDSTIGDFALVGPYAHVRGGSDVGTGARVGNFVELKAATLGPGVKAGHLSYLGDVASASAATSARARSPATTTARTSTARRSARTSSSARTHRWSRPSRSATAR
jgi:NDP-sugar pyrophosphorylase family protein